MRPDPSKSVMRRHVLGIDIAGNLQLVPFYPVRITSADTMRLNLEFSDNPILTPTLTSMISSTPKPPWTGRAIQKASESTFTLPETGAVRGHHLLTLTPPADRTYETHRSLRGEPA